MLRRWPRELRRWDRADQAWDRDQEVEQVLEPVAVDQVAQEVLAAPEVREVREARVLQVALEAAQANGPGVRESGEDLLVTATGQLGHPLTMPPLAVKVRPRFSLRYNLANPPHPIAHAHRVRIFLSSKFP